MVDLSDTKARPVGGSRSRSGGTAVPVSHHRSRDYERNVSNVGIVGNTQAASNDALSNSLNAFYGLIEQDKRTEHAFAMDEIRRNNIAFTREANNQAVQRPSEFKKAMLSGDWSAFPELSPEMVNSTAFQENGLLAIGKNDGVGMANDPEILERIAAADDPEAERALILNEQLKGSSSIQREGANATFLTLTDKAVADRKQVLRFEASEDQFDAAMGAADAAFDMREVNTYEDYLALRGSVSTSRQVLGSVAVKDSEDAFDLHVLKRCVVDGDNGACRVAAMTDPGDHNGLSITDRVPKEIVQKLQQDAIANYGKPQSQAEHSSLMEIYKSLDRGDWMTATSQLSSHEGQYGDDGTIGLRSKITTAMGSAVGHAINIENIIAGRPPVDYKEARKSSFDDYLTFEQQMADRGIEDEDTVFSMMAGHYGTVEPNDEMKGYLTRAIDSSDPAIRDKAIKFLTKAGEDAHNMLTSDGVAKWDFIKASLERGDSIEFAIEKYHDPNRGSKGLTKANVLKERFNWNTADRVERVGDVVKLAMQSRRAAGDSSFSEGWFGMQGTPDLDDDEVAAEVLTRATDLYENAALLNGTDNPDMLDRIVRDQLGREIGVQWDIDRGAVVTLTGSYSGSPVTIAGSKPGRMVRPDAAYLQDGLDEMQQLGGVLGWSVQRPTGPAEVGGTEGFIPAPRGPVLQDFRRGQQWQLAVYGEDTWTKHNKGMGLKFRTSEDGVPHYIEYAPGDTIVVPKFRGRSPLYTGFAPRPDILASAMGDYSDEQFMVVQVPTRDTLALDRFAWVNVGGLMQLREIGPPPGRGAQAVEDAKHFVQPPAPEPFDAFSGGS